MATWQQTRTGYYPVQQAPPPTEYYQDDSGYPKQSGYQQQQGQGYYQTGSDPNMQSYSADAPLTGGNFNFSEKSVRRSFIRKVYAILMCQLAVTLAIGTLFVVPGSIKTYLQSSPNIWWIAFLFAIGTLLAMSCFDSTRRTAPLNYIFLLIFTIAESFLVGVTVSVHNAEVVIWAVGICAIVCLGLTIFAFQTTFDFTVCGGILFVSVLILFLASIVMIFLPPSNTGIIIYASVGALIFSVYIIYDTQLMMGGEHKYSISPEEYIFASLNLYIDIINLFLYILAIVSNSRD